MQRWGPPAGTPRPSPWLPGRARPRARRARLCNTCARAFATCACARTFARLCVCTRGLGRTLPRPSRGRPLWEGKLRQGWGRGWQPPLMTPAGPAVSSVCSSAPGSGPSSPNSSHSAIAENGFTGSVPNIHAEVGAAGEGGTRVCGERAVSVLGGGGGVCMFRCLPRARSGCTRVSGRARPGGVLSVRTCGQTRAASVLGVHACAQVCAAKVLGVCTYAQTCAVSVFRVQVRAVSVLGVHVWSGACSQGTCSGHARVRNERAQGAHARDASVLRERACAM